METQSMDQELAQLQRVYDILTDFLVQYSFQMVGALLIFLLGLWLASRVSRLVARLFEKHEIDVTLSRFISGLVRVLIILLVAVIALGKLGISVTPIVAAIGAASLGAGLALQGMLANYMAGVTIIITRPFVVGNTIELNQVSGVVQTIRLGQTLLTNEEGELISVPNKHIVGEILHNSYENRLVVSHFNISYSSDAEQVVTLVRQVLDDSPVVSRDQQAQVGINGFNTIGLEIGLRYWVATQSYYQHKYEINMAVMKALTQAGIEIPCPVREIHVESKADQERAA